MERTGSRSEPPSSANGPEKAVGQVIAGKYLLLRLLGQGGMGAVYEGRNEMTGKRCAVKLLLAPELAYNVALVKRFFREARASSAIESDHVVEVYDSGTDPATARPYMVMELLHGQDLHAVLDRLGPVEPLVAAKLTLQAAVGLAKAHDAGVVHRDIKPANLFVTKRDSGDLIVKILDFGIAKVKMDNFHDTSGGLTRTGSMLGSPLYMSPEQCRGAARTDTRTDVWSLGVVLFELLSGSTPYAGHESLGDLIASIITEDLPLLQDRAPWAPPELAEIVHRALSRDISRRYQNAGQVRDALLAIVPGGALITPDMLTGLRDDHRAWVAPRLVLTDDGMLRAITKTGLAVSADELPVRKSRGGVVLLGLAALAALGVGAAAFAKVGPFATQPSAVPATIPTPPPAVEPPGPAVTPVAAPVRKEFLLEVSPVDVEVAVDGAPARVEDGKVKIEGVVGTTKTVRLARSGKTEEKLVAITDTSLVPSKLELAPAPDPRSPARARSRPKPSKPDAPAQPAAPAPAPTKPASGNLRVDTDEFGR
jgi:serine/threonine-protein kinase